MINQANPDVLWVALGLPKQERWIVAHRDRLKAPVIVAIGAAIKFHSGKVVPAPRWASQVRLGMVLAVAARAPHRLATGLDLRPPIYGSLAPRCDGAQAGTQGREGQGNCASAAVKAYTRHLSVDQDGKVS